MNEAAFTVNEAFKMANLNSGYQDDDNQEESSYHAIDFNRFQEDSLNVTSFKSLDDLKELSIPMSEKKHLRLEFIKSQGRIRDKSKWSSGVSKRRKIYKEGLQDVIDRIELWKSSLHHIEGKFGSGIRSYFSFLRLLFLLNLYIFLLVFFFIVVPTLIFQNLSNFALISVYAAERNVSDECAYNPYNPEEVNSFSQYIIWWFTGQGFLEKTLLFSGYYDNIATVDPRVTAYFNYDIPLAYLLVAFFSFFVSLIVVVWRSAYVLKESLSSDAKVYSYCSKLFGGWDYCIIEEKAAKLKQNNINLDLSADLEEDRMKEKQKNRTTKDKIILYIIRILVNVLIIVILGGSLVAIFFAAQYALQNSSTYDDDFFLDLLITYLVSIVITVANFISPLLFQLLVKIEDYSTNFSISLTLVRTVVLRLASIIFLYVVVYLQIFCERYPNIVDIQFNTDCSYCEGVACWETYLGQEMYKLTLFDFFIVIAVTLFVEFPRKLIVDNCNCGLSRLVGYQEFDIISNVLGLVYAQTVAWIGSFYAPLLPVMVVIKFFIFFYLKKLTLMYNCQPASRPYRASRTGTFFYMILLFGFIVAVFPVAIGISIIRPSMDCGPFRNWPSMFYAITSSIMITLPTWAQEMFWFFGSAPFATILVVLLAILAYYFYASNSASKKTIRFLQNQLTLEGENKQFLMNSNRGEGRNQRYQRNFRYQHDVTTQQQQQ